MSSPLEGTASASAAIGRVHYTHDAMIDIMIAHPSISQGDLAKHFGYTQAWVSRIINSDAFLARLAERKNDLVDPSIRLSMDEKLKALADQSLGILMEKLSTTKSTDLAVKALEISTKALGYGARVQNQNTQMNFVVAMPAKIADAGEWAARARAAGAAAGAAPEAEVEVIEDAVEVHVEIPAASPDLAKLLAG